jgi:Acyclic terpene utilisation family protein AtuA
VYDERGRFGNENRFSPFISGFGVEMIRFNAGATENKRTTVRIGGASGFWGDSATGAKQLVESGEIDYLVFDYLAETTMAILAAMKAKKPDLGYATDFVDVAMKMVLPKVMAQGIKVVSNAGGLNPKSCALAVEALARSMGLSPKIAVVEGDDVIDQMAPPLKALSANAYLGAFPVAGALAEGADIVITGRGVDSAVTLGALIHEFGWTETDFDQLAGGSLGGHIIECGCQATGGLFTDWDRVPDWANIGYPIIECAADGSFELFKPKATGGLISVASVAEQLLYEIGDPRCYQLPDVVCDFSNVVIEPIGSERVRVSGAKGHAPSNFYKVSATTMRGYRCTGALVIVGRDASAKAQRTAEAIIERCEMLFKQRGFDSFSSSALSLLGAETLYGAHARTKHSREIWLRLTVSHPQKEALALFAREIAPAGTSWAPGTTGPNLARPAVTPAIQQFSLLIDKTSVPVQWSLGDKKTTVAPKLFVADPASSTQVHVVEPVALKALSTSRQNARYTEVPLFRLAHGRSGDKGDISNIGIVARRSEWMPLLWDQVTPHTVGEYLKHLVRGPIERYYLPGIQALNLVMHQALDGGGPQSARMDPLGKGMAQILLDMPIRVPEEFELIAFEQS